MDFCELILHSHKIFFTLDFFKMLESIRSNDSPYLVSIVVLYVLQLSTITNCPLKKTSISIDFVIVVWSGSGYPSGIILNTKDPGNEGIRTS